MVVEAVGTKAVAVAEVRVVRVLVVGGLGRLGERRDCPPGGEAARWRGPRKAAAADVRGKGIR